MSSEQPDYMIGWYANDYPPEAVKLDWFTDELGFVDEDRLKVGALMIGSTVSLGESPIGNYCFVTRVG